MRQLIAIALGLSVGLAACGGAGSETTQTTTATSSVQTTAPEQAGSTSPSFEVGPELADVAERASAAGYEVEGLPPSKLRTFGGANASETLRASAGMTVLGPGLGGQSSGKGGATVYAFASGQQAAAQMQALQGLAAEKIGTVVYFVGQTPPSPGLEKLIDAAG